jgi:hypothetical protein
MMTFGDERLPVFFWKKCIAIDSGCWIWLGSGTHDGYGQTKINRKQVYAHRASYAANSRELMSGYEIDHLCSNRGCVNPAHLEQVTHTENVRRGRRADSRGEKNPAAVLTADDVRQIRTIGRSMTLVEIAKKFGVSFPAVHKILSGRTWRSVP